MKMLKRITAIVTATAMLVVGNIGILPKDAVREFVLSASASDEDIVASGECGAQGDNLTWTLDSEGALTISGKGEMDIWELLSNVPWDSYKYDIVSVVIENGVTSIGEGAFYCCVNLTSISIPNSITSIGALAFNITPWLEEQKKMNPLVIVNGIIIDGSLCKGDVIIPDSVTTIGDDAFYDCESLTSISIPDSVTSIGEDAFRGCESLTSIKIPNGVTSIEDSTFYCCRGLTTVTIPDSVTTIGDYAFYDCESLTSITIPDSVTSIGSSAFYDCASLTSITIPDSVTSIGHSAFSNCTSLTSARIPNSIASSILNTGLNSNILTNIIRPRKKKYSFSDNINEKIILANVTPVKLNRDLYSTYDEITDYNLFGHLDRLQEVCTISGEIYAVYGENDNIIMLPKNESLQSLEIRNEGYTFGAATIGGIVKKCAVKEYPKSWIGRS